MDRARITTRQVPTGRFALLGLFAVLLFQLEFALHAQLDHDLAESVEASCEVCIKLDQGGNAPPEDGKAAALLAPTTVELTAGVAISTGRSTDTYAARAPPRI